MDNPAVPARTGRLPIENKMKPSNRNQSILLGYAVPGSGKTTVINEVIRHFPALRAYPSAISSPLNIASVTYTRILTNQSRIDFVSGLNDLNCGHFCAFHTVDSFLQRLAKPWLADGQEAVSDLIGKDPETKAGRNLANVFLTGSLSLGDMLKAWSLDPGIANTAQYGIMRRIADPVVPDAELIPNSLFPGGVIDLLILDEAQDITLAKLAPILCLYAIGRIRHVLITGDDRQMVYSGMKPTTCPSLAKGDGSVPGTNRIDISGFLWGAHRVFQGRVDERAVQAIEGMERLDTSHRFSHGLLTRMNAAYSEYHGELPGRNGKSPALFNIAGLYSDAIFPDPIRGADRERPGDFFGIVTNIADIDRDVAKNTHMVLGVRNLYKASENVPNGDELARIEAAYGKRVITLFRQEFIDLFFTRLNPKKEDGRPLREVLQSHEVGFAAETLRLDTGLSLFRNFVERREEIDADYGYILDCHFDPASAKPGDDEGPGIHLARLIKRSLSLFVAYCGAFGFVEARVRDRHPIARRLDTYCQGVIRDYAGMVAARTDAELAEFLATATGRCVSSFEELDHFFGMNLNHWFYEGLCGSNGFLYYTSIHKSKGLTLEGYALIATGKVRESGRPVHKCHPFSGTIDLLYVALTRSRRGGYLWIR